MTKKQEQVDRIVPGEASDTDLPDDSVNEDAFRALQENYEGDPDEVDGHTDQEGV